MTDRVPDPLDAVDAAALAELDAGPPEGVRAARADPRAAEVLDALAATRADLAAAGEPELPPEVAARWSAALAAEGAGRVRRSYRRRAVLVAAAAAVVLGIVGIAVLRPAHPVLTVSRVDLLAVATSAVGTMDTGALADPARRDACLHAVLPGAAGERLLGGRRVVLDGRPGVLLVLATGTRGGLHVVTVDPDCGPGGGTLMAQVTVG